jgi:outer membrane protein TolC
MYEYQSTILHGFVDVASSLVTVEQIDAVVEHRTAQLDALGETIATADLLFAAGQASYLEVLTAQQNALAAELKLIEALKIQRLSRLLLYKALGGGWR